MKESVILMLNKMQMITIGIAEYNNSLQETICLHMSRVQDCSVSIKAKDGFDLIDQLQRAKQRPSMIFLNVNLPVMDGVSTTFYLKTHYPEIYIVAFSDYRHHLVVQDMFDAGATGFILIDNITETLLSSVIAGVILGKPMVDPDIHLGELISVPVKISTSNAANIGINNRELSFLQLSATTLTIEQIALLMNVATESIYNYQKSLKSKLGLGTRQELTIYALQHDIARVAHFKTLTSIALSKTDPQ